LPAPLITPQGGCAETPAQAKRKASQLEDRERPPADAYDLDIGRWMMEDDEPEEEIVHTTRKKAANAPPPAATQTKKVNGGRGGR